MIKAQSSRLFFPLYHSLYVRCIRNRYLFWVAWKWLTFRQNLSFVWHAKLQITYAWVSGADRFTGDVKLCNQPSRALAVNTRSMTNLAHLLYDAKFAWNTQTSTDANAIRYVWIFDSIESLQNNAGKVKVNDESLRRLNQGYFYYQLFYLRKRKLKFKVREKGEFLLILFIFFTEAKNHPTWLYLWQIFSIYLCITFTSLHSYHLIKN